MLCLLFKVIVELYNLSSEAEKEDENWMHDYGEDNFWYTKVTDDKYVKVFGDDLMS